jgi:hypothetical protein
VPGSPQLQQGFGVVQKVRIDRDRDLDVLAGDRSKREQNRQPRISRGADLQVLGRSKPVLFGGPVTVSDVPFGKSAVVTV